MDKVILELCDKFGVTVEKLIPQVIQHGQMSSGFALRISIIGAVVLTAILIGLFFLRRWADSFSALEDLCDIGLIAFGIILFVAVACVVFNAYDHYMWMHSPRIMAIKYILNSVGGK